MNFITTWCSGMFDRFSSNAAEARKNDATAAAEKTLTNNSYKVIKTMADAFAKFDQSIGDINAAIKGEANTVISRVVPEKAEVRDGRVVHVKCPVETKEVTLTLSEFVNNPRKGEQESRRNNSLRTIIATLGELEKWPGFPGHDQLTGAHGGESLLDRTICSDSEGRITARGLQNKRDVQRVEARLAADRTAGRDETEKNLLQLMSEIQALGRAGYVREGRARRNVLRKQLFGARRQASNMESQPKRELEQSAALRQSMETTQCGENHDVPKDAAREREFSQFAYSALADKVMATQMRSTENSKKMERLMRLIASQVTLQDASIPLVATIYFEKIRNERPELDSMSVLVVAMRFADAYLNDMNFLMKNWAEWSGLRSANLVQTERDALEALQYCIEIEPEQLTSLRRTLEERQREERDDVLKDTAYIQAIFDWVENDDTEHVPHAEKKPIDALNNKPEKIDEVARRATGPEKQRVGLAPPMKKPNPDHFRTHEDLRRSVTSDPLKRTKKADKLDGPNVQGSAAWWVETTPVEKQGARLHNEVWKMLARLADRKGKT